MKTAIFILSFLTSLAFADGYNDNFDTNPLNLEWGVSIQEVQKSYPGGLVWPTKDKEREMNYSLSIDRAIYWGGIPAKNVILSFAPENKLEQIIFQFGYADYQEVKRRSLEIFGASEIIKEENGVHKIYWKSPQGVFKMLSINSTPSFEWVYFGVVKKPGAGDGKKGANQ